MIDLARVCGWLYVIPMVLFLLFFGVPLMVRGVWWVFLWPPPAYARRRPIASLQHDIEII